MAIQETFRKLAADNFTRLEIRIFLRSEYIYNNNLKNLLLLICHESSP